MEQPTFNIVRHFNKVQLLTEQMLCAYFRARLSCQQTELKGTHPFHFSGRRLLRDKLISFWVVLHYCSPVEACFQGCFFCLEQNKCDEKKNKMHVSIYKWIHRQLSEYIWTCLTMQGGKDGPLTAVTAGQLTSDFCSHGH